MYYFSATLKIYSRMQTCYHKSDIQERGKGVKARMWFLQDSQAAHHF